MAKSYVEYTADGSTNQFNLTFSYLDQSHVVVTFDSVAQGFSWINTSRVQTTSSPAAGVLVRVARVTPTSALTVYPPSSTLKGADLTRALAQSLYLAEEEDDAVDAISASTAEMQEIVAHLLGITPPALGTQKSVYLSTAVASGLTLAQADTAATAAGSVLVLDHDYTLTGNTVLTAPAILGAGGIITRAGFTLSGAFWAPPNKQMFDSTGTGRITYTGRYRSAHAGWYGPKGDLTTDDWRPLQSFVTDVSSGGFRGYFNYITSKITAPLVIATGASYYELDGGGALLKQATDNTPIFQLQLSVSNAQSIEWAIHHFQFHWANVQPSTNTRAIGICFTSTAAAPGWFEFSIHHISMPLYGFMAIGRDPNSTNLDLQWQCSIEDIDVGGGVTGGVIDFLTGNTGGSPIIQIRRVFHYGQSATKPTIGLYAYEGADIMQVERNQHSGSQPLIRLESSQNISIQNCKCEADTYTADTVLVLANNSLNVTIDGFDLVSPNAAVGKTVTIAKNGGTNIADLAQVTLRNFACLNDYSNFLGALELVKSDGNPIIVGRYLAGGTNILVCPVASFPYLRYEDEKWAGGVVTNVQSIATSSGIYSAPVPRKCLLVKAVLQLKGVTGGSVQVEVRKNLVSIGSGAYTGTLSADGVVEINLHAINGPTGASNVFVPGDFVTLYVGSTNTLTGSVIGSVSFVFVRTI